MSNWLVSFFNQFVSYMPDFGKKLFTKRMRANQLVSKCSNCIRLNCNRPHYKTLGMVFENHEDKVKVIKDGLSKELLDHMLQSLEMHQTEYMQREIHNLLKLFQKESA